jgi:hypothetical protein
MKLGTFRVSILKLIIAKFENFVFGKKYIDRDIMNKFM